MARQKATWGSFGPSSSSFILPSWPRTLRKGGPTATRSVVQTPRHVFDSGGGRPYDGFGAFGTGIEGSAPRSRDRAVARIGAMRQAHGRAITECEICAYSKGRVPRYATISLTAGSGRMRDRWRDSGRRRHQPELRLERRGGGAGDARIAASSTASTSGCGPKACAADNGV